MPFYGKQLCLLLILCTRGYRFYRLDADFKIHINPIIVKQTAAATNLQVVAAAVCYLSIPKFIYKK
jgi:hypothetical protein